MSDTRPFPLRHMASVPARSYAMLDQCAAQTAANGLHDPLIYLSPADIRTAFADAIYATNNSFVMTYAADKKVTFNFFNAMFSALNPQRPPGAPHTQNATITPFYDCTNLDLTCTITNPA